VPLTNPFQHLAQAVAILPSWDELGSTGVRNTATATTDAGKIGTITRSPSLADIALSQTSPVMTAGVSTAGEVFLGFPNLAQQAAGCSKTLYLSLHCFV